MKCTHTVFLLASKVLARALRGSLSPLGRSRCSLYIFNNKKSGREFGIFIECSALIWCASELCISDLQWKALAQQEKQTRALASRTPSLALTVSLRQSLLGSLA